MSNHRTDNSFLWDKIALRLNHIPHKPLLTVLDAFGGDDVIWNKIKERYDGEINILRCDQKADKKGAYLRGNNVKFLRAMDLSRFDVIDLDAYGYPYAQLKEIFKWHHRRRLEAMVFVTAIQVSFNALPYGMLEELGYPKAMIRKIPTLFAGNGIEKMRRYLALHGVHKINRRSSDRKHYFCFELKKT